MRRRFLYREVEYEADEFDVGGMARSAVDDWVLTADILVEEVPSRWRLRFFDVKGHPIGSWPLAEPRLDYLTDKELCTLLEQALRKADEGSQHGAS